MKLVFPDEQALLLGDTGWFPGALGYRFIFEASTQNVERYVLLDTMPQAGDGDGRSRPVTAGEEMGFYKPWCVKVMLVIWDYLGLFG